MHTPITRQEDSKKSLAKRDGYQCVATGHYDEHRYDELGLDDLDLNPVETEGAHIIPSSYGNRNSNEVT